MALAYFAYGSNMLTERLVRRCPSARPVAPAVLENHALAFSKIGNEGSGKATLVERPGETVFGVVFMLDLSERGLLDAFEGRGNGYDRIDDCAVRLLKDEAMVSACTYKAPPAFRDPALLPFDWYHALVIAGARQHGLPADYVDWLAAAPCRADPDRSRPSGIEAREVLAGAGFDGDGAFAGYRP
ncbi:gamma-glutamylcyclotransferase [Martelella mediterranea]|uniref:gamma-glutamylcyclotransferase family protein n=1 Tax=Martelella mediterranea TaxID=293089 RepID=UPI001E58996E|nr:gamma-glutamylcyclotransferase family protein [Martelella mediterranea]MCD1634071.1 gamma-glutamylcyclotransferase [Martelella mediterranea]